MSQQLLSATKPSESSRVIDYENAEIVAGFVNDTFFLVVSGHAPCLNMDVTLSPLIYVTCPDYWGIEVVGTLKGGFCLTAIRPYTVSIPLAGITGSKGVELIGRSKSEQFDVTGGCS
ncbi:hypothetical protein [Sphingomonas sanxanigenens]|uniref:hypothetical protein n=1 Tax=Sphingomonas sanxanigenens TaxID=397260 RepID=UPI0009FFB9B6|nr:hypothetical protein [Sphingomonas sanxanigenens]